MELDREGRCNTPSSEGLWGSVVDSITVVMIVMTYNLVPMIMTCRSEDELLKRRLVEIAQVLGI
jgi:ABC-type spermidine/putrescine transport system permease subunit I